jgi:hypothetical protein
MILRPRSTGEQIDARGSPANATVFAESDCQCAQSWRSIYEVQTSSSGRCGEAQPQRGVDKHGGLIRKIEISVH